MTAAAPPGQKAAEIRSGSPQTATNTLGWSTLMGFPSPCVSIDHEVVMRCPHCQGPGVRLPLGAEGARVGRSMLLTDGELNRFKVEKPWARRAAVDCGPEAAISWDYENNAPPLADPPTLSPNAKLLLEASRQRTPFLTNPSGGRSPI